MFIGHKKPLEITATSAAVSRGQWSGFISRTEASLTRPVLVIAQSPHDVMCVREKIIVYVCHVVISRGDFNLTAH